MNRSIQRVRRYAKALLDVAEQAGGVEAVRSDLEAVRRWIDAAPAFHVFAACDRFGGREARLRAVLELARAAGLDRRTAEFLARIEAAQDLDHLGEILDEFERLWRERTGIVRAEIVSARPLAADQKAELARRFGQGLAGRRLEISYKEDPGILGGFVARIGEQIHDYSVSGRLARLRRRLVEA
jgi:F-type H+-transporting ATPase subunit delta